MSAQTVIMFIVSMILVSGAIISFSQINSQTSTSEVLDESTLGGTVTQARIARVSVTDMYEFQAERVEIEVIGGSQPLPLEQVELLIRTDTSGQRYQAQLQP